MADKIIILPDSFKGSMTSGQVSEIIAGEIRKVSDCETKCFPIADGGEGSVDCILSFTGGEKQVCRVMSPENKEIEAYYGITEAGRAIIEFAESSGITKQTSYEATKATSYGFGQLILDALNRGIRQFTLCLGGSATTEGACGMAAALGVRFFDADGKQFVPVGESLQKIRQIDLQEMDPRIEESTFEVMCDVENPLYGLKGAAYVYGPQKGADGQQVELLDAGLQHLSEVVMQLTGKDLSQVPGAGAAGGAGFGLMVFLRGRLRSGIDVVLDLCEFDREIKEASLVITGEGKLDHQSLMGKVLSGIKRRSGETKVVSFCGICDLEQQVLEQAGVRAVEIGRGIPLEESMQNGPKYLQEKCKAFCKEYFAL